VRLLQARRLALPALARFTNHVRALRHLETRGCPRPRRRDAGLLHGAEVALGCGHHDGEGPSFGVARSRTCGTVGIQRIDPVGVPAVVDEAQRTIAAESSNRTRASFACAVAIACGAAMPSKKARGWPATSTHTRRASMLGAVLTKRGQVVRRRDSSGRGPHHLAAVEGAQRKGVGARENARTPRELAR